MSLDDNEDKFYSTDYNAVSFVQMWISLSATYIRHPCVNDSHFILLVICQVCLSVLVSVSWWPVASLLLLVVVST
jgi:hypothetical protein